MLTEANDIWVRYRLDGLEPSHGAEKPPVVMLSHALATKLEVWDPQIDALSECFQILRYDIRGHGGSDIMSGPYQLETLVEDAVQLLSRCQISQVHFVGLSLGGMIGQLLAATHPELVASLVLCSTSYRTPPEKRAEWDQRIQIAQTAGMRAHVEPTIARWFTADFVRDHPNEVSPIRDMIGSTYEQGYAGCAHVVRDLDLTDKLPLIKAPALVMGGENDAGNPPETTADFAARIGAEVKIVPSSAHLCNVEQPDLFNNTLLEFLAARL